MQVYQTHQIRPHSKPAPIKLFLQPGSYFLALTYTEIIGEGLEIWNLKISLCYDVDKHVWEACSLPQQITDLPAPRQKELLPSRAEWKRITELINEYEELPF